MINSTDCAIVMGQRGCGKSYLAKGFQSLWPRRIIIDSLNEYREGTIVHNFPDFADTLLHFQQSGQKEFELVYQFDFDSHMSESEFNEIIRLCYYLGNVQIVIEEVQLYSSPHSLPRNLKNALLTGRHQNISLLFTSQRPGEVNKTIISQCSHIFVGRISEGNDLNYLSKILNQDSERLISLPDRQFLYFSKNGVQQISNDVFRT